MTPDERAALRALAESASDAPWSAHGGLVIRGEEPEQWWVTNAEYGTPEQCGADAAFIAAARDAVPALLGALDAADQAIRATGDLFDAACRDADDARAALDRVRALCDEEEAHGQVYGVLPAVVVSRIRRAIEGES